MMGMKTAGLISSGMDRLVGAGPLDQYLGALDMRARFSGSKTDAMMASVLRQLVKADIVTNENFCTAMNDPRRLLEAYERHLRSKGNKDLRTPRSRLRAVLDDYRQRQADYDDLDFAETFRALVKARYGELEVGKGRATTGVTLTLVGRDIVSHWQNEGLVERDLCAPDLKVLTSTLARWYRGPRAARGHLPARHKFHAHIESLERFFGVPTDYLAAKLAANTVDFTPMHEPKNFTHRRKLAVLPEEVDQMARAYSDYKRKGIRPRILHFPETADSPERRRRFRLYSVNNGGRSRWTDGPLGDCRSEVGFFSVLRSYYSYLIHEREPVSDLVSPTNVTPIALTNMNLLEGYVDFIIRRGVGFQNAARLINFVISATAKGGFIRHCVAAPNGYASAQWFDDLDELREFLPVLRAELKDGDRDYRPDPKRHVRFILAMDTQEAHQYINRMSEQAFKVARRSRKRRFGHAMRYGQIGLFLMLMRVCPLRAINWTEMHYFPDDRLNDMLRASLSYIEEANRYRLFVPTESLKNRERQNIRAIDITLPGTFNEYIEEYINYRNNYIEKVLKMDPAQIGELTIGSSRGALGYLLGSTSLSTRFRVVTFGILQRMDKQRQQVGINIHAMRHLMATLYLRENPGDYPALASLLHDSLEVVVKEYAEVEIDHHHARIVEWAEKHA